MNLLINVVRKEQKGEGTFENFKQGEEQRLREWQWKKTARMLERCQDSGLEGERGRLGDFLSPPLMPPHLSPSLPLVKPTSLSCSFFLLSILSFQSSPLFQPSGDNESHLESTFCASGASYSS